MYKMLSKSEEWDAESIPTNNGLPVTTCVTAGTAVDGLSQKMCVPQLTICYYNKIRPELV